jgi:hypothetical protein
MTVADDRRPVARGSRILGAVSFIVSALALIVGVVGSVIRLRTFYSSPSASISGISVTNYVELGLAVVGIVLGAIAWKRRAAGSILGAIGVGLGVAIAAPLLVYLGLQLFLSVTQLAGYHP